MTQGNTESAYDDIMLMVPEITYLRKEFQPLIASFFDDDEECNNQVNFC